MRATLVCLAKAPVPGRVKTRLCPPCTPEQASALAAAALADTLTALSAAPATRRLLVLDGRPGDWLPEGFDVAPQVPGGLDARLAGAFAAAGGPALLVGMDTPQATPSLLAHGLSRLAEPGTDAVLGGAPDGGYWAIGLRRPAAEVFMGVPMSVSWTAAAQRERLLELGLTVAELPSLRDVDSADDAVAVAAEIPGTRFAAAVARAGLRPALAA